MTRKAQTFDSYLAALTKEQRTTLEKLRTMIRAMVPDAEECISYGLPAFKLDGKPIAGLGASDNHCAYYPMSGSVIAKLSDELAKYETSKGTIRFPIGKILPKPLVKKLLDTRIAEVRGSTSPVDEFIAKLESPLKPTIELLRKVILSVDPKIGEGIKWNAPSFRIDDDFATMNLRKDQLWLILHTGAKVKSFAKTGLNIKDPDELLEWPAKDRAIVKFADIKDLKAKSSGLKAILKQWIREVVTV